MEALKNDVRYAVRMLIKKPGFAITALLTIALGIAATTAIVTVVNAVLLRPMPVREPGSVVVVHDQLPTLNLPRTQVSAPQFVDYSRQSIFASTAAITVRNFNLTGVNV